MTQETTVDDTIIYVDHYNQSCQLASLLPPAPDEPNWLGCDDCGHCLGCMGNSQGIVLGHFKRRDREWSRLTSAAIIAERRIGLKCGFCGKLNRWYQNRNS